MFVEFDFSVLQPRSLGAFFVCIFSFYTTRQPRSHFLTKPHKNKEKTMDNNNYKQDYITAKEGYLARKGCLRASPTRFCQAP